MEKNFAYLKAIEGFAQYWHQENADAQPVCNTPRKHPYRSVFACDRDRVMYCSAFRRLSSKTQIFNSQTGDNLRTRLTHTLEVAQIARTIACQLGLDEELTEAIALGHDVGHTPFGHVGERTINLFSNGGDKRQKADGLAIKPTYRGFKHNLQSVRVLVEYSENVKFSNFMLFGVGEHSRRYWKNPEDVVFYKPYENYCSYQNETRCVPAWSFEAYLVKWADEVAQRHHDIEDAYLQKIMSVPDIIAKLEPLSNGIQDKESNRKFERLKEEAGKIVDKAQQNSFAHTLSSFLVDSYVTILIEEFQNILNYFSNTYDIHSEEDFQNKYLEIPVEEVREKMELKDTEIYKIDKKLGKSLKYSILDSYEVQRMDGKGAYTIRKLIRAYLSNPQQLPNEYVNRFIKIEIDRSLDADERKNFRSKLKKAIGEDYTQNISSWKDYQCREALRAITNDDEMFCSVYSELARTVFDYIAGMTDSYATTQKIELY